MEFTINGAEYRATKLSVFDQLKVSRKLMPLIAKLISDAAILKAASQDKTATSEQTFAVIEAVLPKIADVIADMPDESVSAIINPCLKIVSRKTITGHWAGIFADDVLMFDDIDLMTMLNIVCRVVVDNLGNFLHAATISETPAVQ